MSELAPGLDYFERDQWGADESLPRLGYQVSADKRTEMIHHHTVIKDDDDTKNIWETQSEVFARMHQLQTIRPDLGLDVPYNYVAFLMADETVMLCEGRGVARTGAHTHGHNTSGIAIALQGNFEIATNMAPYLARLSWAWGWLKYDKALGLLGSEHPARREVYGHRDFAQTACPGRYLFEALFHIKAVRYQPEEDTMLELRLYLDKRDGKHWLVEVVKATGTPYSKKHFPHKPTVQDLMREFGLRKVGDPGEYTQEQFDTIKDIHSH